MQQLPAPLFDFYLEICLEYFESGLQIRLKVVKRQVPGQVSLSEAWYVAFRRALEALDLNHEPSKLAFVFHLERVLQEDAQAHIFQDGKKE